MGDNGVMSLVRSAKEKEKRCVSPFFVISSMVCPHTYGVLISPLGLKGSVEMRDYVCFFRRPLGLRAIYVLE